MEARFVALIESSNVAFAEHKAALPKVVSDLQEAGVERSRINMALDGTRELNEKTEKMRADLEILAVELKSLIDSTKATSAVQIEERGIGMGGTVQVELVFHYGSWQQFGKDRRQGQRRKRSIKCRVHLTKKCCYIKVPFLFMQVQDFHVILLIHHWKTFKLCSVFLDLRLEHR